MDSIVEEFVQAQKDCYRGNGAHVEWITAAANTSHSRCRPNVSIHIRSMQEYMYLPVDKNRGYGCSASVDLWSVQPKPTNTVQLFNPLTSTVAI